MNSRSIMHRTRVCLLAVVAALPGGLLHSVEQKERTTLRPKEEWSAIFAEKAVTFHFTVKAARDFTGRAVWTFAAENRTVLPKGRGEARLKVAAGQSAEFKVPLETPPLRPGVTLATTLTVALLADGAKDAAAVHERTLWVFGADPFAGRTKWLKEFKIALWDPDPQRKTAKAFESLKIPFEELPAAANLVAVKEGVLVIGQGASFRDEPRLAEDLVRAARRGVPVLCLAPAEGTFLLPGAGPGGDAPRGFRFRRQDVITEFDKRLDARAWPPDGKVTAGSLALKAEDGKVVVEVLPGGGAWPWLEIEFPEEKSRLVFASFNFIGQWEAGPAPRHLLARLFEWLTDARGGPGPRIRSPSG
jgi:hypothetical protein